MNFRYDEHNKFHRFGKLALITAASLLVMVWIWWMVAVIMDKPSIPRPAETFDALIYLIQHGDPVDHIPFATYLKNSLLKLFRGFLLAVVVALPVGLLMGWSKTMREFLTPMVEILRPIAPIAWTPIFFAVFVSSDGDTKVASTMVVFIGIVFPLLTNISFGVTKIEKVIIDAAKTLGASNLQIFLKVIIPSTIPYLMNGIKIGLGIGWMCIVAAELKDGFYPGVGSYVFNMVTYGQMPEAYAGIIVISVLGLLTTGVAGYIHNVVNKRMGVDI